MPARLAFGSMAVTVGPDDSVYVSDAANSRIRRITADGKIQTVTGFGGGEGLGGTGFVGDGGPAEKAKLFSPADLKFDRADPGANITHLAKMKFQALFADGTAKVVDQKKHPNLLPFFSPAGGEEVPEGF